MKKAALWILGLLVTATVITCYWFSPPIMYQFDLMYQNAHFKLRGPVSPGQEVVIAAIDEKSIDELGRWPWPRKHLARLVDKLGERQARVIGFDMVFSSPDESAGLQNLIELKEELKNKAKVDPVVSQTIGRFIQASDYDALFAASLGKASGLVMGYFFHFAPEGLRHLSERALHGFFQNIKHAQFSGFIKSSANVDLSAIDFRSAYAVESNIPVLSKAVRQSGFINVDMEADSSIRKLPLIIKYHDKETRQDYFFPPLAIRVLEKYLGGTLLFRVGEFGIEKVLLDGRVPLEIMTNNRGEVQINFMGPRNTYPHYSVTDIIHDRKGEVPDGSLRDKIVLIGATATGLENIKNTPFDPGFPGVEIHATLIDNILHKNFLHEPEWIRFFDVGYLGILGLLLTLVYSRIRPGYGFLLWVLTLLGQFAFSHWMMVTQTVWITDVFPMIENTLILSWLMAYRYNTEIRQKQMIENVFSKFLPSRVIDQLLKDPSRLKLGGEQKELTALFTDLAGFTTFSEQYSPEELVHMLNTYLTEMTDILFKYEGTLDKYDGDAIKTFFGAPLYFEDHARRACWVAIEMQARLGKLRRQWKKEGKPELFMRVGVNTGLMVVGNIGSKNRMNYGINGDSVNLASRLEAANKEYGTHSLISEATYRQARDFIEARELDFIRVVGRSEPVKVYELLGKAGEVDEAIRNILPIYNKGLKFYKARNWEEAIACFDRVLQILPGDGPSLTFKNRCLNFRSNPPSEVWDGVYHLTTK